MVTDGGRDRIRALQGQVISAVPRTVSEASVAVENTLPMKRINVGGTPTRLDASRGLFALKNSGLDRPRYRTHETTDRTEFTDG
jgi:hypothetical protein